jgi:hypothetical protein
LAEQDPQEQQEQAYDRWSRPQALSNRGYVLALVVPVLIAAAAFGVVSLVSAGDETGSGVSVHLPVSGWEPGDGGDSAAIEGVLMVDADHCVYLENGDTKVWPVWPAGYHATLDDNRLSLFDPDDTVAIAVDGDHVRMSGGSAPASNYASEPCVPDSGEVAVVQSDVTVVQ